MFECFTLLKNDRPVFKSLKKREKYLDYAHDRIRQLKQAWDERLTFANLAESYLKGKLRVHVHWHSIDPLNSQQYCAIFQSHSAPELSMSAFDGRKESIQRNDGVDVPLEPIVVAGKCYQKSVFVYDIKTVQTPKRSVPSLVRTKGLDEVACIPADAFYLSHTPRVEIIEALTDRKRGARVDRFPVRENQASDKIIQAGPQIVDRISDDGQDFRRHFFDYAECDNTIAGLDIIVSDLAIGLTLKKEVNRRIKIIDVLFGPFNLGLDGRNAVKFGHK
jgi:hypothetical protein